MCAEDYKPAELVVVAETAAAEATLKTVDFHSENDVYYAGEDVKPLRELTGEDP